MSRWMSWGLLLSGTFSLFYGLLQVSLGRSSENTLILFVFGIVFFLFAAAIREAGGKTG